MFAKRERPTSPTSDILPTPTIEGSVTWELQPDELEFTDKLGKYKNYKHYLPIQQTSNNNECLK